MSDILTNFAHNKLFNQKNEKNISTPVFSSVHAVCIFVVQFLWV